MSIVKSNKRKKPEFFDKYEICQKYNDILRIKTSTIPKFNTWVVPCSSDAVCIKHGETKFVSYIINEHIFLSAYMYDELFIEMLETYKDSYNTHLIVPCYFEEGKQSGDYLDVGIAVNGKCKEDE